MSVKVCLSADFSQVEVKDDVIEVLANNLKEDLERDVLKVTLKESLALASKGTKLQNGPANDLLYCILRSLSLASIETANPAEAEEESDDESDDEMDEKEESGDEDDDESLSQMLKMARQKAALSGKKKNKQAPAPNASQKQKQIQNTHQIKEIKDKKKHQENSKEICRYYARGKCNKARECRFDHPNICKKFRQLGSVSNNKKGCDGKCNDFHPKKVLFLNHYESFFLNH